jgi:meiosis-specific protein HOP1
MQKMELLPRGRAAFHFASLLTPKPGRRFATFKIFYTDNTPLDYEPPHFQAGDMEKDKWYFMTHDFDEVPDRYSIGKLDTGHHGFVSIRILVDAYSVLFAE